MTTNIADAETVLTDWVLELNPALDRTEVTSTTPLLSERLVSSLQVAELLLILEMLQGKPVDISRIGPGVFKDIQTIIATFLPDAR